jgi:phospholipase C
VNDDTFGMPRGLCTHGCTTSADCGSSGACVSVNGTRVCAPSCAHGADCREGYNCVPQPSGEHACMPVCDRDAECGTGAFCNLETGFCESHTPTPSGATDGAPCGEWPDGADNCRGLCHPAWERHADGTRTPTGFTGGMCHSWCDVGPEWSAPLTSFPASTCPASTVCVPTSLPVMVGDLGDCLPSCTVDTDCRDGYACLHGPRPTDRFTDGYCAPIDCNDGTHHCPANAYCEVGYDAAHPMAGRCHPANIEHVVLIVQENHTFDSYFGNYCTAPTGSNPTCELGAGCCEHAPATVSGQAPGVLTDAENYARDRHHDYPCEICQIHDGAMDRFVTGGCPGSSSIAPPLAACSSNYTFEVADSTTMATYWRYADHGALADHYFQPIVGSTSSNDMYFAVAHYEFRDNDIMPDSWGSNCVTNQLSAPSQGYQTLVSQTIADLLLDNGLSFVTYADGYGDALAAVAGCSDPMHSSCPCTHTYASDCRESLLFRQACTYDGSDIPFQYYARFRDDPRTIRDYESRFVADVAAGQLPDFTYVKFRTSRNEHPNWSYITDGERWVDQVVSTIEGSPLYRDNTLVLLAWDEGGGFYDHVPPPASVESFPSDDPSRPSMAGQPIPYGTRVPFLAIGRFARSGAISHVQLEHSSVVRFLEFLFLGPRAQGALGVRDDRVNNIGSMLDAAQVGVTVP